MANKRLRPQDYGLPSRTVLEAHNDGFALLVDRKSRLIMADGKRILAKVLALRASGAVQPIVLKTSAPVCRKTKALLADADVTVLPL